MFSLYFVWGNLSVSENVFQQFEKNCNEAQRKKVTVHLFRKPAAFHDPDTNIPLIVSLQTVCSVLFVLQLVLNEMNEHK